MLTIRSDVDGTSNKHVYVEMMRSSHASGTTAADRLVSRMSSLYTIRRGQNNSVQEGGSIALSYKVFRVSSCATRLQGLAFALCKGSPFSLLPALPDRGNVGLLRSKQLAQCGLQRAQLTTNILQQIVSEKSS